MSTEKLKIISRKEAKELGLKRYYTGKPCKHGHLDERAVRDRGCITCANISRNNHRTKNQEKYKEDLTKWRKLNKVKIKAYDKARYDTNKSYFSNKNKRWHKDNPEKARLKVQRRKAKKLNQSPPLSKEEVKRLNDAAFKAWCYSQVTEWVFHLDHIIPISKGGLHHPDNIQILEASANISKHNLLESELEARDGCAKRFFLGARI